MKKILIILGAVAILAVGASVTSAQSVPGCTLTAFPAYVPFGLNTNITLTLSGTGMSGSFVVPLIGADHSQTYTLSIPTGGPFNTHYVSCSATVIGRIGGPA